MDPLWLLKGDHDAPGWKPIEKDAREDKIDWVLFDRDAWVLMRAKEPPTHYEGMVPGEPPDGLYVDQQGNHVSIVSRQVVRGPEDVVRALGDDAKALWEKLGDPVAALERLGKAF